MYKYDCPEVVPYGPLEPGPPNLWVVLYRNQTSVFNDENQARDHAVGVQEARPGNPPGMSQDFLSD